MAQGYDYVIAGGGGSAGCVPASRLSAAGATVLLPEAGPADAHPFIHIYVREWAKTDYHPVGTCKMGVDPLAVVDIDLRVKGIERLRVCDSSVMPLEISANTNAPTIMIAEKASDLILAAAGSRPAASRAPA